MAAQALLGTAPVIGTALASPVVPGPGISGLSRTSPLLTFFRTQFPEFNGVSDSLVLNNLNAAVLQIDLSVFGALGAYTVGVPMTADQAVMFVAAHKLAVSAWGQNAKMVLSAKDGWQRTTYGREYWILALGQTSGYRVA